MLPSPPPFAMSSFTQSLSSSQREMSKSEREAALSIFSCCEAECVIGFIHNISCPHVEMQRCVNRLGGRGGSVVSVRIPSIREAALIPEVDKDGG